MPPVTRSTSASPSKITKGKEKPSKNQIRSRKGPIALEASGDVEHVTKSDSDALDDGEQEESYVKLQKRKQRSPRNTRNKKLKASMKSDSEDEGQLCLATGQEVVGVVVQAPKTGRVPPGQISQNTLDFLLKLKDPKCNDRQWFKLHEPVYRALEKEWKDFVEEFTNILTGVDEQIPHLPPNDVIHRIYRDIRFSNDKTPYKQGISASFSRSGRKGIFAGYHIAVKPGGESLIAAGSWCPGKNELANIRTNILRDSTRLRSTITCSEFVRWFGPPETTADRPRSNIFGMEDELKVAPKGIDKNHKDIDLLKCRSFAVVHRFLDSEVLEADFKDKLAEVARVMKPLVHCINDMMTLPQDEESDEDVVNND